MDGAGWGRAGEIAFASDGLWTVPDSGGEPERILESDSSSLFSPVFLPDGHTVVFTESSSSGWSEAHVSSIDLATKERKTLLTSASDAQLSPTGHLVFMRDASLLAVPLDAARVEVVGAAVPLLAGIMQSVNARTSANETGMGQFALSDSGTLVYAAGSIYPTAATALVRVDRNGRETELAAAIEGRRLSRVRLSPDAKRVVVKIGGVGTRSRARDLWMFDLGADTPTRLTSTGDADNPVFAPDGKSLLFERASTAKRDLYSLELNANSAPQLIMAGRPGLGPRPASWSADGSWLAYIQRNGAGAASAQQIFVRSTKSPMPESEADLGEPRQFSPSTFTQRDAYFSPDGRWLVYTSNESGNNEVYVQAFPGPGEKRRISTNGGSNPAWSRDGKQLFYLTRDLGAGTLTESQSASMMTVDVTTGGGFQAGAPRQLFEGPYIVTSPLRGYDVTPDGQFIMARLRASPDQRVTKLNVVLGWAEELKRRVPSPR